MVHNETDQSKQLRVLHGLQRLAVKPAGQSVSVSDEAGARLAAWFCRGPELKEDCMRNTVMKLGRRKAGTWGPPRKGNKRVANKAARRFLNKEI